MSNELTSPDLHALSLFIDAVQQAAVQTGVIPCDGPLTVRLHDDTTVQIGVLHDGDNHPDSWYLAVV